MKRRLMIGLCLGALSLAGCGGGSTGSGVASTPTPPPSPPPAPPPPPPLPTVQLFDSPATQNFTVINGPNATSSIALHYDAPTHTYEIAVDDAVGQALRGCGCNNPELYRYGPEANPGSFVSHGGTGIGFAFSTIGQWFDPGGSTGLAAIGEATPANGVPLLGSANYYGQIVGDTDAQPGQGFTRSKISGTIQLGFDFASGSLTGQIAPTISYMATNAGPWDFPISQQLGPISFVDTVHAVGSTQFSGRFDTNLAGANSFDGMFTGPGAEELIGKWTLPFIWSSDPQAGGDGQLHSSWGVMIGQR